MFWKFFSSKCFCAEDYCVCACVCVCECVCVYVCVCMCGAGLVPLPDFTLDFDFWIFMSSFMQLQYSTQIKMLQKKHLNAKSWKIIGEMPMIEFISVKLQA